MRETTCWAVLGYTGLHRPSPPARELCGHSLASALYRLGPRSTNCGTQYEPYGCRALQVTSVLSDDLLSAFPALCFGLVDSIEE